MRMNMRSFLRLTGLKGSTVVLCAEEVRTQEKWVFEKDGAAAVPLSTPVPRKEWPEQVPDVIAVSLPK